MREGDSRRCPPVACPGHSGRGQILSEKPAGRRKQFDAQVDAFTACAEQVARAAPAPSGPAITAGYEVIGEEPAGGPEPLDVDEARQLTGRGAPEPLAPGRHRKSGQPSHPGMAKRRPAARSERNWLGFERSLTRSRRARRGRQGLSGLARGLIATAAATAALVIAGIVFLLTGSTLGGTSMIVLGAVMPVLLGILLAVHGTMEARHQMLARMTPQQRQAYMIAETAAMWAGAAAVHAHAKHGRERQAAQTAAQNAAWQSQQRHHELISAIKQQGQQPARPGPAPQQGFGPTYGMPGVPPPDPSPEHMRSTQGWW